MPELRRESHNPMGPVVVLDCGPIHPEDWRHLHGKALSGHRHSHRLRPGESVDEPDHWHEGRGPEQDARPEAVYPGPPTPSMEDDP
jgi:hypothetical protein